jgi:hypothetical protein
MHRSKFRNVVVLVVALAGIPASAGAQPAPLTDGRAEMAATLVRLLSDPDPMVRKYARDALTVTRPTEAVPNGSGLRSASLPKSPPPMRAMRW